ncbi:cytochrome P450 [Candidatus Poriferisodalis sp.]|uniref:cytochrome P450 n=1 Tax=Candidatus Poriferisodalis sp. TaxID=3101277 RepID=UPI003AF5C8AA
MTIHSTKTAATQALSLPEELVLMLLNEESGYFHQVPGWNLNCAVAGAALAELSLQTRVDTDMESLILLDETPTGSPVLDLVLLQIANETQQHNAQYWVEKLASRAEMMIDLTLDRLTSLGVLEYHDGDFWTLAPRARQSELFAGDGEDTAVEFIKPRIEKLIFGDDIPHPRDIIIIALVNTCDVLRFVFDLDENAEQRIQLLSHMDLIGRAIADAVAQNLVSPRSQASPLTKSIPTLPLRRMLMNRHLRNGNIPAAFADFAEECGPVFQVKAPLYGGPMTFIVGPQVNRWVHRYGRMYLGSGDYLRGLESAYHASGLLPALDGADHFRMRRALRSSYSRARLDQRIGEVCNDIRNHMEDWSVGDSWRAVTMCRRLVNAHLTPLLISVEAQDLFDDLVAYKIRALMTQVVNVMPKFLLKTRGMKKKAKAIDILRDRVLDSHTAAQREGCPRDHADDVLSLHQSDPVFLPESNLRFIFSAPLLASTYSGDELCFMVYAMISRPDIYAKIRAEADALFEHGDPNPKDINPSSIDVTHRFIMECFRLYPIVPMSIRNVMNSCVVENYELPIGSRVFIAQTASHYMSQVFPDPHTFDIDRYLPSRGEHRTTAYAPFGLGTHGCLGSHLVEMQLALALLMLAHYFELEVAPASYKLKISSFPSLSPNRKLKFTIAKRRHELVV